MQRSQAFQRQVTEFVEAISRYLDWFNLVRRSKFFTFFLWLTAVYYINEDIFVTYNPLSVICKMIEWELVKIMHPNMLCFSSGVIQIIVINFRPRAKTPKSFDYTEVKNQVKLKNIQVIFQTLIVFYFSLCPCRYGLFLFI